MSGNLLNRDPAIRIIRQYTHDDLRNHLLEFFQELAGIVCLLLDLTQLFLPDTGQLRRLQQFFANELYQFHPCGCGDEVFPFFANVITLEQRFDDGGTRGRTTDSVLFQRIA